MRRFKFVATKRELGEQRRKFQIKKLSKSEVK